MRLCFGGRAGDGCRDSACADDLYCDAAGICQRQRSDGAACDDDEQCLSHDCVESVCEGSGDDDICFF